jgi:hypothetical protein
VPEVKQLLIFDGGMKNLVPEGFQSTIKHQASSINNKDLQGHSDNLLRHA